MIYNSPSSKLNVSKALIVLGFCFGGRYVHLSAARLDINGGASFHGALIGKHLDETSNIKWSLVNQMANKVRWTESIDSLGKINDFNIIEVGPGKILSGLIKKINDNFSIKSINSVEDLKLFKNGFVDE